MNEESIETRLRGKAARRRLATLYGEDAVEAQIRRWSALARKADERYGSGSWRLFSAPGRTELGGNHTDHNGGRVLAAAVQLDAAACVRRADDDRVVLESEGWAEPFEVDLSTLDPVPSELGTTEALIRGVAAAFASRGYPIGGFRGLMTSDVSPGSGLSSSAAVEVLIGTIFDALYGDGSVDDLEIALMGQEAENRHFGKPCGLMDQTASAVGGIVAIDFARDGLPKVRKLKADFAASGLELAVVHSGGSHADLTNDYAAIPGEMRAAAAVLGRERLGKATVDEVLRSLSAIRTAAGDRAALRALHFAKENERVDAMVTALREGRLKRYLKLVRRSGDSSWRLLQNVSPSSAPGQQGVALAIVLSQEILGRDAAVRVHGGGFAGTIQVYVPTEAWEEYVERMEAVFGSGSVTRLRVRPEGRVEL